MPLVASCARYREEPLNLAPASLRIPDTAILSRDAATIDRAYLKPIAIDLAQPLDANAVAVVAVLANPDLKALRARAGVADAQAFATGLFPDPSFSFAIEQATRAALKAEYSARLAQTRAEIAAAAGAIAVAKRQRAALLADLPALTRFVQANTRAARRGDLALATAQTAEAALRDKQLLLAQTVQTISEQTIALELLTGAPRESWPR